MTSSITEIQALIADLDSLLNNKNNLMSRLISTQGQEAQAVLEKIRDFLARLETNETQTESSPRSPLLVQFADRERYLGDKSPFQYPEVSALLQPLQTELQMLLQERANLVQEIRQLEQKRLHNYSVAQQMENQEQMISEFLRVLMHRMEGKLSFDYSVGAGENQVETANQVEHLQHLANDLDRRLVALDGTVNVVFEGLQRNIYTYHESLSQAIARMHSKGIQGEELLTALIDNLTGVLRYKSTVDRSELDIQPENLPMYPSLSTSEGDFEADSFATQLDNNSKYLLNSEDNYQFSPQHQEVEPQSNHPTSLHAESEETQAFSDSSDQKIEPPDLGLNNSDSLSARVDQLYASLFGSETENTSNTESVKPPEPANITEENTSTNSIPVPDENPEPKPPLDTTELTTINVSNLVSAEVHQAPIIDNSTDENSDNFPVPDMWFDRPDAGLLGIGHVNSAIPQEIIKKNNTSDIDNNTNTEITEPAKNTLDNIPSQIPLAPSSTDTVEPITQESIGSLSDLFAYTEETSPEESSIAKAETDETNPDNTSVEYDAKSLVADTESGYLEKSLDDYVLASPQENLLQEKVYREVEVPEISLDEDNLQQLPQDLDLFDNGFDSQHNLTEELEATNSTLEFPSNSPEEQVLSETLEKVAVGAKLTPLEETQTPEVTTTELATNSTVNDQKANSQLSVFNRVNTPDLPISTVEGIWYLGIDLGSTGISAVLLNRSTTEVYPIYWSSEEPSNPNSPGSSFRLPAEVYIPTVVTEKPGEQENVPAPPEQLQNLFSAQLKPYLQIAIPYKNQQKWEPFLELNEYSTVPLVWVVRSLSKLLLTLKSDRTSTTPGLIACAVGIQQQKFHQIISNIAGVICNCPANSSEQYRFNLREALITGKIVEHPQQVFFIEDAIANLLAALDNPNGEPIKFNVPNALPHDNQPLEGNTLIINIGASTTEMGLIDVPNNLLDLNHDDFMLHGFAYAGKGIEQDIISQLLLPEKWRESSQVNPELTKTISRDPWHWQPSIPGLEQMRWHSLRLAELKLPRPGEPDIPERIHLQQGLESSLLGKAVLDAAVALKLILQHQESFTLELADQRWTLQRRDLESQVFVPFVRRLNRELNKLLVARGIPTEAINQAILTGGVSSITAVTKWLRQKLPNAKIIQDPYVGDNGSPACSRTAYGLALLPLHPQALDIPKQQYTDYFLFTELLRLLPDREISLNEITQLFEGRGINTRICQHRLLTFIEGELPSGLLPGTLDYHWLAPISQENSFYKQLATVPLFEKRGSLTYRPNSQQIKSLLIYLDIIKASTQQSLEEPYTVNFALGVTV